MTERSTILLSHHHHHHHLHLALAVLTLWLWMMLLYSLATRLAHLLASLSRLCWSAVPPSVCSCIT